jgi:cell division protein FtsL
MRKTTGPKIRFRRGEKLILTVLTVLAILTPVVIVYTSACLSSSNIEVERLKKQIEKQENVNSGLSMEVDELASLSNIQEIAKVYGLSYNNDNIVVVK